MYTGAYGGANGNQNQWYKYVYQLYISSELKFTNIIIYTKH